ncbi:unnamed protein product [Calicophoron daubneyi]|uniref:Phosphodiesterase n=1 Tax=Calicophoron daubneyi TaxID=300641 RepID=A0AAV2TNX9_CALDB
MSFTKEFGDHIKKGHRWHKELLRRFSPFGQLTTKVNDVGLLLGSLITKRELQEQAKMVAKILFPACEAAELVIRDEKHPTLDCPMEVIMRGIQSKPNRDVQIKQIPVELARHIVNMINEKSIMFTFQKEKDELNLVSFYLEQPASFKDQTAEFVIIASELPRSAMRRAAYLQQQLSVALSRVDRLEQLTLSAYNQSIRLVRRPRQGKVPCCSKAPNLIERWVENDRSPFIEFFQTLVDIDPDKLQTEVMTYLFHQTSAETGFLALKIPDGKEFVCHFPGGDRLDEPICADFTEEPFKQLLKEKRTLYISPLTAEQIQTITQILAAGARVSVLMDRGKMKNVKIGQNIFSLMCYPFYSGDSDNLECVVVLVNKVSGTTQETLYTKFSPIDQNIVQECITYTMPLLRCSVAYQNEQLVKLKTQEMLKVAGNIFLHTMDLTDLLLRIMKEARNLTKAERCSVFLLEKETGVLVAKVLDGLPTAPDKNTKFVTASGETVTLPEEIRISANQGIAGYVATTGQILNIKNAYEHPLFYSGVDEQTGFRTRNILCFPIKNEKNGIVGVAQLCNKINFPYFTSADEDVAKTFAFYCCISIVQSLMYKKVQDAQHRTKVANEMMIYHMQVSEEKLSWLATCEILRLEKFIPNSWKLCSIPRAVASDHDSYLAVLAMFNELGLIRRWRLCRKTLAHFILLVRQSYRDPPYHNWTHAFSVCHFIYICGRNLPLEGIMLEKMEFFALFVASLCHDMDHRGTNNSFQVQSQSLLAALYSSEGSVMERHHFSQTICVLNTAGCNIFESLQEAEYTKMLDLIRDCILATDLGHHLSILPRQRQMATEGYEVENPEHHYLLLSLLMTAADLSDQTKNWRNTVQVAKLIYEEFFRQGDLEKAMGHSPSDGMDRRRSCVPSLQIGFLDFIITPMLEVMVQLFPQSADFVDVVRRNRARWEYILKKVQSHELKGSGLEIFEYDLENFQFPERL